MIWFVLALVSFIVALGYGVYYGKEKGDYGPSPIPIVVFAVIGLVLLGASGIYTQDVREVKVLRSFTGNLDGYTAESGLHVKKPWDDVITYDVSNNIINLYRNADYSTDGGKGEGPEITVNDSSGTSCNIDAQVIYSLDGDTALNLYADYGTQEAFTRDYIMNSVRSTAREVAGQFDTITMLTNRGEFTQKLQEELTNQWSSLGLKVDTVSVQDIRYPDDITNKYAEAQASEIEKTKAENDKAVAQVQAETKVVTAQGEAEANSTLQQSLTPEVIQQHYIDALTQIGQNGNLVVVPEGSTPMVNVNK